MTSRGGDLRGDDPGRRAAAFVEASGDPLERIAAWGLIGARPVSGAVASLESTQRSDGAYGGFDASPGWLATTLRTLGVLDDLGAPETNHHENRHVGGGSREVGVPNGI